MQHTNVTINETELKENSQNNKKINETNKKERKTLTSQTVIQSSNKTVHETLT